MKHRPGSMLLEAALAITLLLAAAAAMTQLLLLAAHQRRQADRRALATREAANVIERIVAQPWPEITADRVKDYELSQEALHWLREPELEIQVSDEDLAVDSKRVDVSVRLQSSAGLPAEAVELSAWTFSQVDGE